MPVTTTYMSLVTWPAVSDFFDHTVLASNFTAIDAHDHTSGKGIQIPTGGILDAAVTPPKVSGLHVTDTYANRPTATSALNGVRFFATDKMMEWQCISAVWVLMTVFAPEVASLPVSPIDQQACIYVADATNGIKWHLRYRSGASGSYKWEFIGGPVMFSEVTTSESTTSTSYVALTTAGPTVTVPLAGDYDVTIGANVTGSADAMNAYMSYALGGTAASDSDAIRKQQSGAAYYGEPTSRKRRKTGLTAATAIAARYKVGNVTGTWENRWMSVIPVRVG